MMHSNFPVALPVLLIAIAPVVAAPGQDWPQWRGVRGDGISQETEWASRLGDPQRLWEKQIGVGCSSMAVRDTRVYAAGWADGRSTVFCLDATTGEEIWKSSYEIQKWDKMHHGGPGATPAVDGDRVYVVSRDGELFCFDAVDGTKRWSKKLAPNGGPPSWGFTGSPVIYSDRLYANAGRIVALDKVTGSVIWQTANLGAAYSTPVRYEHGGRTLVATFPSSGLVLLDDADGSVIARHAWKTSYDVNAATPVVDGDRVFIASGYGTGCAMLRLEGSSFSVIWENKRMKNKMATCVLIDGHLYGFDESVLRCLDADTGAKKWKRSGLGLGSLMAAGNRLVVLGDDGTLVIADADPSEYREHARYQVFKTSNCWVAPVLSHGRIYCRSQEGELVCLNVSGGP